MGQAAAEKAFRERVFMVIYAMREEDTICAVSTPAGAGGIGIIRVSGRRAIEICAKVLSAGAGSALASAASHTVHYGQVRDRERGEQIDEVLVTVMRAPRTYTREDVVEINCHGGAMPLRRTLGLLIAQGARQADPGEFTKRAFLNGRIDLVQAEAVMDVIHAQTERSLRAANQQLQGALSKEIAALRERLVGIIAGVEAGIDFPEEDIETPTGRAVKDELQEIVKSVRSLIEGATYGQVLREGVATAIVGRPNVGKSSLLNALLRQDRAIVTDVPGTTRDVLEEYLNLEGVPLKIVDTAGIRHTHDIVEQEGVRRSRQAISSADIVLVVLDGSAPATEDDRRVLEAARGKVTVAVINKCDQPRKLERLEWPETQVEVSCRTGDGLSELRRKVTGLLETGLLPPTDHAWAVNDRHRQALEETGRSMARAQGSVQDGRSPEFIALDLRDALDHLGTIIGATHTEDILERIFRDFCIGK